MTDMFKGDDAGLIESINAAIELNRDGAMTPRIPTMAIELLTSAAVRLARATDDASLVKGETLSDDEWPRALERLRNTEPRPDQGIACVGVRDLEMALDRLKQFAEVAMGNAMEVSRLTSALAARGAGEAWSNYDDGDPDGAPPAGFASPPVGGSTGIPADRALSKEGDANG